MSLNYIKKLALKTQKTNIRVCKIDDSTLKTFKMVIADFQVEDKVNKPKFFQKIFLVIDIKFEVILGIPFLKISNIDMLFDEKILMWKSYTTNKVIPTIKQVQLIDPKKFVIAALDADSKTFVVQMAIKKQEKIIINPVKKAQIGA